MNYVEKDKAIRYDDEVPKGKWRIGRRNFP